LQRSEGAERRALPSLHERPDARQATVDAGCRRGGAQVAADAVREGGSVKRRSPNAREAFNEDVIQELIVWNAPDHEHTRIQLRGVLEEIIGEQFDIYDTFGGDAAQGLEPSGIGRSSA
jgi:hypothetical protein